MEEDPDCTELWLTWNDHGKVLRNVLSTLRYKELYADVTLVCGEKRYSVHKFILSTCSAFFENLLESLPGHNPVIVLTNMSTNDLERLLDFMYLGQTEVSSEDLEKLMDIAYEFRIRGLISSRDDPYKVNKQDEDAEEEEEPVTVPDMRDSLATPTSDELNTYPVQQESQDDVKMEPEPPKEEIKLQEEEDIPQQNGPEGIEPQNTHIKNDEEIKPPAVDGGLKEYQNFIRKLQMNEDSDDMEVIALDPLRETSPSPVKKKIPTKHHCPKCKKDKCKCGTEKLKGVVKKHNDKSKIGRGGGASSKEKSKGHKVEEKKTRIMMCPGCKKTFMNQSVLEEHMKTHSELEIVCCPKCSFKALGKLQMKKHMLTHQQKIEHESRPFHCPYCPARQVDRLSFLTHQRRLHPDKKVVSMSPRVVLEDVKMKDYQLRKSIETPLPS